MSKGIIVRKPLDRPRLVGPEREAYRGRSRGKLSLGAV